MKTLDCTDEKEEASEYWYLGTTPVRSNSHHHHDYSTFRRESLWTFICDCYCVGGRPNWYDMDPCSIILFLVCLLKPKHLLESAAQDFPGQQVVEGDDPLCCLVILGVTDAWPFWNRWKAEVVGFTPVGDSQVFFSVDDRCPMPVEFAKIADGMLRGWKLVQRGQYIYIYIIHSERIKSKSSRWKNPYTSTP